MIPLLACLSGRPASAPPPAPLLALSFPAGVLTATMAEAATMNVTVDYNAPGEPVDYIDWQVLVPSGAQIQWSPDIGGPWEVRNRTVAFPVLRPDVTWEGPGVYRFLAVARRVATGEFDVLSNSITLTVTP